MVQEFGEAGLDRRVLGGFGVDCYGGSPLFMRKRIKMRRAAIHSTAAI
jgi:hypothetical protein